MPKSATAHAVGSRRPVSRLAHLDPEAVVAEEDVADARRRASASVSMLAAVAAAAHRLPRRAIRSRAAHPAPRPRRGGRTGSGPAIRRARRPDRRRGSRRGARPPSTSCEHTGDRGVRSGEEEVVGVSPPSGPQANRRALPDLAPRRPTWCPSTGRHAGVDRWLPPRQPAPAWGGSASSGPARRTDRSDSRRAGAPRPPAACRRTGRRSPRRARSVPRASAFSSSVRRQRAQGEDLVDLGRVAEVARALRGDRRVVVEDDRRRQHHRVSPSHRSAPGRCRRCAVARPPRAPVPADRAARRTSRIDARPAVCDGDERPAP